MAKRGGTKHQKRLASPKAVPIQDKKERKWMIQHSPGPHAKDYSIPLGVLLRDILKIAPTLREVQKILSTRLLQVDGKVRTDDKFSVGLMDVISLPKAEKNYRIIVDGKARLLTVEIKGEESATKTLRVVRKHTLPGGKLSLTLHDGRNIVSDNHIKVGDSVVVSLPKVVIKNHLKRDNGATCLIMDGKHAGTIVKLKDIIQRKGGKPSEALVQSKEEEFITVAKYLFVVDESFRVNQ